MTTLKTTPMDRDRASAATSGSMIDVQVIRALIHDAALAAELETEARELKAANQLLQERMTELERENNTLTMTLEEHRDIRAVILAENADLRNQLRAALAAPDAEGGKERKG